MDRGTWFSKYWLRNIKSFLAKVDYLFQAKSYNICRKTKFFTSHSTLATEQQLRKREKFRLPSATNQTIYGQRRVPHLKTGNKKIRCPVDAIPKWSMCKEQWRIWD
jgi:hypothetical protein